MSVFCSKCGKENPCNVKKCVFCNEKLQIESNETVQIAIPLKLNKKIICIGVSVAITVVLLLIVFLGNTVPNVDGVDENTAKQILIEKGYSPVIVYEDDNSQPVGCVLGTNPGSGSWLKKGGQVKVFVSAGKTVATSSVLRWTAVTGSLGDDYEFYNPYVQNNYLYIEMEMTLQSDYSVLLRGFGTASINDTYDKTVPLEYEYEKVEVTKGETQKITVRIPLSDLEEQRPTTIYFRLSTYNGGRNESINFELDMTW